MDHYEVVLKKLSEVRNFLSGACFDHRIPKDAREAFQIQIKEIDELFDREFPEPDYDE